MNNGSGTWVSGWRVVTGGKRLFISVVLRNNTQEKNVGKSHAFFFFLWMISRAWEQAGLLYDDSSPCGCSKPKVLQEEVLVVFLWRPAGFSCRERGGEGTDYLSSAIFLQ